MEINKTLAINYLIDLSKKEIDVFERAKIIQELKISTGKSYRELSKMVNVSLARLFEWANWGEIEKEDYEHMKKLGYNKREIFKELFTNKGVNKQKIKEKNNFIVEVERFITYIKPYVTKPKKDEESIRAIKELKNLLNRMEMYIEK